MRAALFTVAAFLAFMTNVWPALADAAKDIGKWSTSCTGGLTCALRYEDPRIGELGAIAFSRSGALSSETTLLLPKPMRFNRDLDPDGTFRLSVDSKAIVDLAVKELDLEPELGTFVSTDQAAVQIILEAMKSGAVLRLDYEGVSGKYTSEMQLDGFRGSLYFIDDVQGRRGRNDALFAVGQKGPEGLDSKDIRSLQDIPASIRADFTIEDGSCTEGFVPEDIGRYNGFDISIDGVRLVLVPCSSAGAYNQPYALYRGYFSGVLHRISFPDVEEGGPSVSEEAYNVDFDPVTRIMTSFVKDNGRGTCGLWHKWRLTEKGNLVLLERRGWYECDSRYPGPEDFPLEWPIEKQR